MIQAAKAAAKCENASVTQRMLGCDPKIFEAQWE